VQWQRPRPAACQPAAAPWAPSAALLATHTGCAATCGSCGAGWQVWGRPLAVGRCFGAAAGGGRHRRVVWFVLPVLTATLIKPAGGSAGITGNCSGSGGRGAHGSGGTGRRALSATCAAAGAAPGSAAGGSEGLGPRVCILGGGFGGLYTAVKLESLIWPRGTKPKASQPAVF
jgi:hypothetical protein